MVQDFTGHVIVCSEFGMFVNRGTLKGLVVHQSIEHKLVNP